MGRKRTVCLTAGYPIIGRQGLALTIGARVNRHEAVAPSEEETSRASASPGRSAAPHRGSSPIPAARGPALIEPSLHFLQRQFATPVVWETRGTLR